MLCPLPCENDRCEILQVLANGVPLGEEIDWMQVAQQTPNFSGADLQSLLATAQVIVAQETLGAELYQGVISHQQDYKDSTTGDGQGSEKGDSHGIENHEEINQHNIKHENIHKLEKNQSEISHHQNILDTGVKNPTIRDDIHISNNFLQQDTSERGHGMENTRQKENYLAQRKKQHKNNIPFSDSQGNATLSVDHNKDAANYLQTSTDNSSPKDVRDTSSEKYSDGMRERILIHGNDVSTANSVNHERTGARPKTRRIVQEQVVIEKERNEVRYSPVRIKVLEENVAVLDKDKRSTVGESALSEHINEKSCTDVYEHPSPQAVSTESSTSNCMHKENKINSVIEDSPNSSLKQVPDFKVYQRHIDAALKEVRPSVLPEDRLKYEQLYATFKQSREGSFGLPTPGKRATLA